MSGAPLSVIPAYQNAQIPLFTFGFGSDADVATLQQMASGTRGKFYNSPASLAAITTAFQDAQSVAAASPSIAAGTIDPRGRNPGISFHGRFHRLAVELLTRPRCQRQLGRPAPGRAQWHTDDAERYLHCGHGKAPQFHRSQPRRRELAFEQPGQQHRPLKSPSPPAASPTASPTPRRSNPRRATS